MNKFFTSDTHFGHANIIRYCNRPQLQSGDTASDGNWATQAIKKTRCNEMDEFLIDRWNKKVNKSSDVFFLGDFNFGGAIDAAYYLRRLNFYYLYVVYGNHDRGLRELNYEIESGNRSFSDLKDKVVFFGDYKEIDIAGRAITLSHYAMRTWNASHHGAWSLFGHSHGSLADDPHALSLDVGIDCNDYAPISFEEVEEKMKKKLFIPIDHHTKKEEGGGIGLNKEDFAKAQRRTLYEQLKKEFQ